MQFMIWLLYLFITGKASPYSHHNLLLRNVVGWCLEQLQPWWRYFHNVVGQEVKVLDTRLQEWQYFQVMMVCDLQGGKNGVIISLLLFFFLRDWGFWFGKCCQSGQKPPGHCVHDMQQRPRMIAAEGMNFWEQVQTSRLLCPDWRWVS